MIKNLTVESFTPIKLSQEEEQLCLRRKSKEDVKNLLRHHWPLILCCAKNIGYRTTVVPDLIQEGIIGFMRAVDRYRFQYNTRLSTFAIYYVRSSMFNFLANNRSVVSIPNYETFQRLQASKKHLLPVHTTNVKNLKDSTDIERKILEESLKQAVYKSFKRAIQDLAKRDKTILLSRMGKSKVNLSILASKHNISIERVRQIEKRSRNKVFAKVAECTGYDPATFRVTGGYSTTELTLQNTNKRA